MKPLIRYGLLVGAVVVAGSGVLVAAISHSRSSPLPSATVAYSGDGTAQGFGHSRGGSKFFTQYDLDHDGKVTREEFNKALAQQFAQSAGGAESMTQAQYVEFRMNGLRPKTDQMFHRDDWNGDGKLTLEEYAEPERVRFEAADRNGTGMIECSARGANSAGSDNYGTSARKSGRAIFCKYDDLNHDGQVTRAEFDQVTAQDFSTHAKGGMLTADQFYAIIATRVQESAARTFARLDTNNDGKLDATEFAASEIRYFARLDRNGDGVITHDETSGQRRYGAVSDDKPGRS